MERWSGLLEWTTGLEYLRGVASTGGVWRSHVHAHGEGSLVVLAAPRGEKEVVSLICLNHGFFLAIRNQDQSNCHPRQLHFSTSSPPRPTTEPCEDFRGRPVQVYTLVVIVVHSLE